MFLLAMLVTLGGTGLLAISIPRHWRQLMGREVCTGAAVIALRLGGVAALIGSLTLCLLRDHPSMAVLVWIMLLVICSVVIALLLSRLPFSR